MGTSNSFDRMVVKIPTGIEPIDRVLGGLERGRCHYLFGSQAAGRAVAAVHFMIRGLQNKERVVFITRSSGPEVVERMSQMGYDYSTDVRTEQFIILEYTDDIVEQIQNLTDFDAVIRELEALLSQRKPARLVLDPISYLFVSKAGGSAASKIRRFVDWLNDFGPTVLIVGGDDDPDEVIGSLHDCCQTALRVNRRTFGSQAADVLSFVKTSASMQLPEEVFMVDSERGIVPVVMRPPTPAPPPAAALPAQAPAVTAPLAASSEQSFPWQMLKQAPPLVIPPPSMSQASPAPTAAALPPPLFVDESLGAPEAPADDRFKVLVIDDDPATCNLISMALQNDCAVTAVHDGPSGLSALKNDSYDLVLLDVNLPIVDGFHVCQHIRKTHWQVPIIIITGTHLRAEDRLQSASVGGDLYLTKPFSVQELRLRVRQLIGRYREVPEWIGAGAGAGLEPISPPSHGLHLQQIVAYEEFIRRLEHERRNSKAVGMPFSVVGCRLQGNGTLESEERMRDLIRSQMRENDVMTIDRDQRSLIILPEASAEGAQIFIQRVRQMTMTETGLDPVFQWRTYPTDGESFEQLLMRGPETQAAAAPAKSLHDQTTEVHPPPRMAAPSSLSQPPAQVASARPAPPAPAAPPPSPPPPALAAPPHPPAALPVQVPSEPPRVELKQPGPAPATAARPPKSRPALREDRAEMADGLDLKSLVKEIFHEELREFVREAVRESMRMSTQQRITPGDIRQMLQSTVQEAQREVIPATKRQLPQPELSSVQIALVPSEPSPAAPGEIVAPPTVGVPAPVPALAPVAEPAPSAAALEAQQPVAPAPPPEPPAPMPEPPASKPARSDLRWSFIDFTQRR